MQTPAYRHFDTIQIGSVVRNDGDLFKVIMKSHDPEYPYIAVESLSIDEIRYAQSIYHYHTVDTLELLKWKANEAKRYRWPHDFARRCLRDTKAS